MFVYHYKQQCYCPGKHPHRLSAYTSSGHSYTTINSDATTSTTTSTASSELVETHLAGPLCFAGDYIAKSVLLPKAVNEGNLIVVHDTGANSMALFSRYVNNMNFITHCR